ncbi:hypothetical protein JCM13304A_01090 [Desulfothermus okinawensis JCM 13304]
MVAFDILTIGGISVTIPFKEKIVPFLDGLTDEAKGVGAVNLVYRDGNRKIGHNTDVDGFLAPIKESKIDSALILGCGGAALACIYGLKKKKIEKIIVAGRDFSKLNSLKRRFNVDVISWEQRGYVKADMLINCTPLGMSSYSNKSPYPDEKGLGKFKIVYDVVYNPLETGLIKSAKKVGIKAISGIYMFIYQALYQFEAWTQKVFDVHEAYRLLMSHLT